MSEPNPDRPVVGGVRPAAAMAVPGDTPVIDADSEGVVAGPIPYRRAPGARRTVLARPIGAQPDARLSEPVAEISRHPSGCLAGVAGAGTRALIGPEPQIVEQIKNLAAVLAKSWPAALDGEALQRPVADP